MQLQMYPTTNIIVTNLRILLVIKFNYSLALAWCFSGLARVAAAALRTAVPRSFTFVSEKSEYDQKPPFRCNRHICKLTENNFVTFLPHLGN